MRAFTRAFVCEVVICGFDVPARLPGLFCSNYLVPGRRAPCCTKVPSFDVWSRWPFSGLRCQERLGAAGTHPSGGPNPEQNSGVLCIALPGFSPEELCREEPYVWDY